MECSLEMPPKFKFLVQNVSKIMMKFKNIPTWMLLVDVNKCLEDKESSYYSIIEVSTFFTIYYFYRHIYDVYETSSC